MLSVRTAMLAMWVEGHKLSDDSIRKILSLTFTDREKKATDGSFVIVDEDYLISDSNVFKKGRKLSFLMGWTAEAMPKGPFVVKSYSFGGGNDGAPKLTVKFQDLSHKMNKKQKRRKHLGNPVNIIKKIAKEHDLGYDIESLAGLLFDDDYSLIQSNLTDAALLQRVANKYGYVWGLEGNTLYFRRPNSLDFTGKQALVPVLSYKVGGATLLTFNFEVKFHKKRKRKEADQTTEDVGLGAEEAIKKAGTAALAASRELIAKISPDVADMLNVDSAQEAGDQEDVSKKDKVTGEKIVKGTTDLDAPSAVFSRIFASQVKDLKDGSKDEKASESDDTGGGAEGDNKDKEKAAIILGTTELIEGTLTPTISSMMYVAGMAIQVVGVGARFSGKHHITEVTQTYNSSGFTTALKRLG